MENSYKVAIIIPYFGKFPEWIDLFLYSCSRNYRLNAVEVHWLIYTDCKLPKKVYSNTLFTQMTFSEYCKMVSQKLDIIFAPKTPYKCCDLKPFYGLIHQNELERGNYTHWGFGDLDLCYGDLSLILNKRNLDRYHLLTTHADRIAGHFTVIKRSSRYTELPLCIENYKDKLLDQRVLGLDEMDYTNLVRPFMPHWLRAHRLVLRIFLCGIYNFMHIPNVIHNFFSKAFIREFYTSPQPKTGEVWTYNLKTGRIEDPCNKSLLYLHFLFFKKTPFWNTPNYWKDGFWQVNSDNVQCGGGTIFFNNNTVEYQKS